MIIVMVYGGLGNQLFQYAAGRALALAKGCELKLDISAFDNYSPHNGFELGLFNMDAQIASPEEISSLVGTQFRLSRLIRRKLGLRKKTHIIERSFDFDHWFFNTKPPALLEGYWQSYKYFNGYDTQIRSELMFRNPATGKNLETAELIAQENSVSIHIRRGDYVTNQSSNKVHGALGIGYYKNAIRRICDEVDSPHFFVFSDDLAWARNNLGLSIAVTFVANNTGKSSFEDMRLMSLCKHFIIANSTFSWWGAWLNKNSGKIVIYPQNWFNDSGIDTQDLTPETWVAIDG